ncbi:MAG: hypothetical protein B7X78_00160 [Sphingomonadales bacterium 39-62-4]|nr:MAG: hypothetical protein B7X78_00160 [Sphingomonadales bacterium 39-62-4]
MSKPTSNDLSGLIKYASRGVWRDCLDEWLTLHLGPVTDEAGLEPDDLFEMVGPHWEGTLWGCAFEDLLTQEFEPNGLNIIDDYLKRRGWNEKAPHKTYMKALRHAVMSLYEVSEVVPGQSMRLRDLLREAEPVTVHERSATQSLANWDRIAARIVTVNGRQIISGGLLPFGLEASATLIAAFHDMASKPDPDAGFDVTDRTQLLRHSAPMFTAMWLHDFLGKVDVGLPELVNSEGEDLEFHTIIFPLANGITQKQAIARLDAHPALTAAGTKFWNWLAQSDRKNRRKTGKQAFVTTMDDGSPVFANVEIKGRMVTLAVNSAGRAAKGRAELAAHLGDLVGTPLTEIRTLEQMLADEATKRPVLDEPEIPPEEMERIVHALLTREYTKALDEPVPMLGDKSPRQLVKTKAGRTKVAEWLKILENGAARAKNDPMATYSFIWMWEELGIAELRI